MLIPDLQMEKLRMTTEELPLFTQPAFGLRCFHSYSPHLTFCTKAWPHPPLHLLPFLSHLSSLFSAQHCQCPWATGENSEGM